MRFQDGQFTSGLIELTNPVDAHRFRRGMMVSIVERPSWWRRLWRYFFRWPRPLPLRVAKVDHRLGVITLEPGERR